MHAAFPGVDSNCFMIGNLQQIVHKYLSLNDYPRSLINRCLNRKNNPNPQNRPNHPNSEELQRYRSIPYIPTLTPRIAKLLQQDYPNIVVAPRSTHTVNNLYTRIKDPIPMLNRHNVIYCIKCDQCECRYIGMTSNLLKNRLSGHRSDVNKLDQLIQSGHTYTDVEVQAHREKTALVSHCIDTGHRFDITQAKILDQSFKRSSLPLLEMIWIHNTADTVNKRTDTDGLNSTYAGILHVLHKHKTKTKPQKHTTQSQLNQST
ncbi:uncharacterized protein LOC120425901 [Culex pipiens pallens]|uniref:uncharacterized protein LOC120425901 n=1 Tax=Culex pipiens pallens TaxID=42434 RepID=UPI0022AAEA06|nr:uncharacterized protein LOC120425901 [Culex pipiens pallens]